MGLSAVKHSALGLSSLHVAAFTNVHWTCLWRPGEGGCRDLVPTVIPQALPWTFSCSTILVFHHLNLFYKLLLLIGVVHRSHVLPSSNGNALPTQEHTLNKEEGGKSISRSSCLTNYAIKSCLIILALSFQGSRVRTDFVHLLALSCFLHAFVLLLMDWGRISICIHCFWLQKSDKMGRKARNNTTVENEAQNLEH